MNFFNSEVFRYLNKGQSKILMYVKDLEFTKRVRDIQGNFAEAPLRSPMLGRCGVRDCWCLFLLRKSSIHHPYQTSNFGPEFSTKVFHSSATKHNTKHWTFYFKNISLYNSLISPLKLKNEVKFSQLAKYCHHLKEQYL